MKIKVKSYSYPVIVSVNDEVYCEHVEYSLTGVHSIECDRCGAPGVMVEDVVDEYDGTPGSIYTIAVPDWSAA